LIEVRPSELNNETDPELSNFGARSFVNIIESSLKMLSIFPSKVDPSAVSVVKIENPLTG
jgi:hypothetical protein